MGRLGKIWEVGNIWEDVGRFGKTKVDWEGLGRFGKTREDLGRFGKT